jgi:hypothetical protein
MGESGHRNGPNQATRRKQRTLGYHPLRSNTVANSRAHRILSNLMVSSL